MDIVPYSDSGRKYFLTLQELYMGGIFHFTKAAYN